VAVAVAVAPEEAAAGCVVAAALEDETGVVGNSTLSFISMG